MTKRISWVIGCILIAASGIVTAKDSMIAAPSMMQEVIQAYLAALSNGDVATLSNLVGGRMKDKSYRSLTANPSYSEFLRSHYAGVTMTVEEITQVGPNYEAIVRFNHPFATTTKMTFILQLVDGQWKVVDEDGF